MIDAPGYCPEHTLDPRETFRRLDGRTPEALKKFYWCADWQKARNHHREVEPLCRRCRAAGKIMAGEMVHHNPPLEELLAKGLDPCDDKYLETLCNRHHMAELRKKITRRGSDLI